MKKPKDFTKWHKIPFKKYRIKIPFNWDNFDNDEIVKMVAKKGDSRKEKLCKAMAYLAEKYGSGLL